MVPINIKDCPSYELNKQKFEHIDQRLNEFKNFSDSRDEESERSINLMSTRLDVMEQRNEKQHAELDEKIGKVETNLTKKIDTLEDNIGIKIDKAFEDNQGKKAIKAWKWLLGLGTPVLVAIILFFIGI